MLFDSLLLLLFHFSNQIDLKFVLYLYVSWLKEQPVKLMGNGQSRPLTFEI